MNLSHGKGWMSTADSGDGWRSGDVVSDEFPVGLRVLVVDDDPTCLMILERMLRACLYEVTKCQRAEEALSLLRGIKNRFDIVLSDVHMPDMDGFKLLEHIGLEMDLPVIMMSVDDGKHVVMKGITHGACDYLIKPIQMEALKNIWQHVVRKRRGEWRELEHSGSFEDGDRLQKQAEEADYSSSANEGSWRNPKRRKEEEEEVEERDDSSALKKPRVVWSVELHQQFVGAVNQLGIDKVVPKKILELMNVPGLSRENVASHLQKYRLYLRRLSGVSQHQSNSFISPQEANFGLISSINNLDLQAFAVTGQLPQNIVTFQVPGISRSAIKYGTLMPLVDQRNIYSFENPNPKLRFIEGQHQNMSNKRPVTLIHGLPAHNLHNTVQSSGILSCNIVTRPPPAAEEPMIGNGGAGNVLGINRSANNGRGTENYLPPDSIIINFPMNRPAELPGNSSSLERAARVSDLLSTGKESIGLEPSFDIFDDLHAFSLNFNASQHVNSLQDCLEVSPSVLVHQEIPTAQKNSNSFSSSKALFLSEEGTKQRVSNNSSELGSILMGNSTKVGDACCRTGLISNHFGQEDLMTAILKQQQDIGTGKNVLDFDGYFYL